MIQNIIKITILFIVLTSCTSSKKILTIDDLKEKNQIYAIKNNSYFYFMIDSIGNKHLVKMRIYNADKVLWIEKLNRY